jgi:GH43 family beta-xylosidase
MRTSSPYRAGSLVLIGILCSFFRVLCLGQPSTPILPNADPFITLHPKDGQYLLLATTGHDITIWSGPTVLTSAMHSKVVYTPPDTLTELWSPTIWKIGDRWWIYFTALRHGSKHAIYVLESDTTDALGSYTYRGPVDLDRPAIDPSLLTIKGVNYLMYVTVDRGQNAIYAVRLSTPTRPSGEKVLLSQPEYPWEKGAGTARTYPVNEGPTALYHDGKTFIVYSASDTASPAYCLGLLSLVGEDPLSRGSWAKAGYPVFAADPGHGVYGPGRGTFAQAQDGSEWLLYAAKSTDEPTAAHRETRAQKFSWNENGTPQFGVPLEEKNNR